MAVALIVAAGSGERLGADGPKAFVVLAGKPMLQWSLEALAAIEAVERIVVALPPSMLTMLGAVAGKPVDAVAGRESRSESVRAALAAADAVHDTVLVHDAARPLAKPELFGAVLAELREQACDAVIAAAPVSDTVKRADRDRNVTETLDRASLWAVQTPQAFRREALERAFDVGDDVLRAATDDASLVERAGGRVRVVPAPAENIKITTPLDLEIAAQLLAARAG